MRRSFVPLLVAATLLVLLGVLGTLQYRWLGEVSNAERERLRTTLRTRAADFSRDFDREITRAYMAFRANPDLFGPGAAPMLADAYRRAQTDSSVGGIIQSVYLAEIDGGSSATLRVLDPAAQTLTVVPWPPELAKWRQPAGTTVGSPVAPPLFVGDAVDGTIPAMYVTLPPAHRFETGAAGTHVAILNDSERATRAAILRLDRDRVERQLLGTLIERHFGVYAASEFSVTVTTRGRDPRVVFASSPQAPLTAATADVATGLFDIRLEQLQTFTATAPPPAAAPAATAVSGAKDRLAVTIVRRTENGPAAASLLAAAADGRGSWQLLVRGKAGSLESIVARSRNRNLAVGLGILGLLAASLVFVVASAQRQHRLARQQMEFVAAVSHELRTPLAVIRSAGENLADGVVADAAQVRKYGTLIGSEGRRLSDMVERVMEYAGMSAAAPLRTRGDVDLARVVDEAASGVGPDARERDVVVTVRAGSGLPPLVGDPDALRSAVQNVIANAVKYSPAGGVVDVHADLDGGRLRVVVIDGGIGIDSADLPHVFKPFYRGRRAVEAQIRGTGVGLSVVRHVVDAHQGEVVIESRAGEGTRVTLTFPAAADGDGYVGDRAEARATP